MHPPQQPQPQPQSTRTPGTRPDDARRRDIHYPTLDSVCVSRVVSACGSNEIHSERRLAGRPPLSAASISPLVPPTATLLANFRATTASKLHSHIAATH